MFSKMNGDFPVGKDSKVLNYTRISHDIHHLLIIFSEMWMLATLRSKPETVLFMFHDIDS